MSAISTILTRLRAAIWARDVRDDIANAIEQCYSDVSNPTLQTEALEAALQEKIDQGEMAALTIGDHTITAAKLAQGVIDNTLATSGAAADAKKTGDEIAAVKADLDAQVSDINASLRDIIGGEAEQREIQFVYGSYINDGNAAEIGDTVDLTNLTNWYSMKHAIVECQEGDEFLIDMVGATNARAWAFLTSNNVLLSRSNANETVTGKITAPQNAGKVIIQGIYRQNQQDTSTDEGTAYKVIEGAGKGAVVRFDTAQDLTDAEKAQARANIGVSNSGGGLSYEAKVALLTCLEHVALYDDEHGESYIMALRNALLNVSYPGIIATYDDSYTVLVGNDVIVLKKYLDVKYYTDESSSGETVSNNDYTLTGAITGNQNTITAVYNGFSSVFSVSAENYDNIRKIEYPNNTKLRSCYGICTATGEYVETGVQSRVIYITEGINDAELPYKSGELVDPDGAYLISVPSWASKVTVRINPASYQLWVGIYVSNWNGNYRVRMTDSGNWNTGSAVVSFTKGNNRLLGVMFRINATADVSNLNVDNISIEFE